MKIVLRCAVHRNGKLTNKCDIKLKCFVSAAGQKKIGIEKTTRQTNHIAHEWQLFVLQSLEKVCSNFKCKSYFIFYVCSLSSFPSHSLSLSLSLLLTVLLYNFSGLWIWWIFDSWRFQQSRKKIVAWSECKYTRVMLSIFLHFNSNIFSPNSVW